MEVPQLLLAREKAEQEIRVAQAKQPAQLLVHGDFLYILDHGWLFQFDANSLELKNVHNLDFLRRQKMRELEAQEQRRAKQKQGERR